MARFFRRGVTKIYYLPAVANTAAPTSGEIAAGVDLSPKLSAITGFSLANTPIMTPDLVSTFDSQIPGVDAAANSTLEFYSDDTSDTTKTTLAKNTAGFLLFAMRGTGTGKPAETWPIKVTSNAEQYSLANDAAKYICGFSITSVPIQNAVLP